MHGSGTGQGATQLRRDIGFFGAAFLVLNSVIGAGIFALPGKVAVNAGLYSPWLFLVVGVLFISVVLTFAELASYYDRTGGPVLYASDAFGPVVGFGTGWLIFLSRMTAFAANANVMATYLASLSDVFASGPARAAIITLVTAGLTWANIHGVKDGVRTMSVLTVLKVVPLLLLVALGLQHVTGATLLPGGDIAIENLGGTTLLLIYAYVASTLPVTTLLQPRDYINAFQLCIAMALLLLGVVIVHPPMVAPATQLDAPGAPALIPLLFITVACGAISGFHCLVSSGTSSKQCDKETSAQTISYGGMLLEGMLAVLVIIACGAGIGLGIEQDGTLFQGTEAFSRHYASWKGNAGLADKLKAFIVGSGNLISGIGLPSKVVLTLMGVFVASFAATTLDTATRLQRYVVSELAHSCRLPWLGRKHPATAVAVITALLLAFSSGGSGTGAMILWPLFGAVNQLLGGLALLVITVWLARRSTAIYYTAIPMVFMIAMTGWAMKINLVNFYTQQNWLLFSIGLIITLLEIWMVVEGLIVLAQLNRKP